jgi:Bacteriophage HK97-gp10, putative tail-component
VAGSVEVDTRQLEKAGRQLAKGLEEGGQAGARSQAERTATAVRNGVPRRTGRLAATVAVVTESGGYGVTYGGGLPYAGYIEKRSNAVADGIEGADTEFAAAMNELAQREARRL